jgi:glutathione S-transferase
MNQWISAVNGYYYPYLIYHVSHERNVFPQLGIPSDEAVVEHASASCRAAWNFCSGLS